MSVINVNKTVFDNEVLKSTKPVLLDFYADWCGPCHMMAPVFRELSDERGDVLFGKVNVDECPELARRFGVVSIPTIVLMKDGKVVKQAVGAMGKDRLSAMLG